MLSRGAESLGWNYRENCGNAEETLNKKESRHRHTTPEEVVA